MMARRGELSECWGEAFGFEHVEFEALVRGLDEETQWPVMCIYCVCGSWSSGERGQGWKYILEDY